MALGKAVTVMLDHLYGIEWWAVMRSRGICTIWRFSDESFPYALTDAEAKLTPKSPYQKLFLLHRSVEFKVGSRRLLLVRYQPIPGVRPRVVSKVILLIRMHAIVRSAKTRKRRRVALLPLGFAPVTAPLALFRVHVPLASVAMRALPRPPATKRLPCV
jgi:hypothetical protein